MEDINRIKISLINVIWAEIDHWKIHQKQSIVRLWLCLNQAQWEEKTFWLSQCSFLGGWEKCKELGLCYNIAQVQTTQITNDFYQLYSEICLLTVRKCYSTVFSREKKKDPLNSVISSFFIQFSKSSRRESYRFAVAL